VFATKKVFLLLAPSSTAAMKILVSFAFQFFFERFTQIVKLRTRFPLSRRLLVFCHYLNIPKREN